MAGYIIGTKEWLEHAKERVVVLGKKLKSSDMTPEEMDELYVEQTRLLMQIHDNTDDNGNPIIKTVKLSELED